PDLFKPRPRTERTIDIVMLANFGTYKRHFELFKALRKMPETISVTLVGQPHGERTAEVLRAEAALYDVAHRITIRERVSNEELTEILCQARVSLIFSLREGSCVAVVESLFADTPVGLFEDAAIGSRVFIDEHTGRFLSHHNLAAELIDFLDHASHYHPREWALDHQLDCYGSTQKLNEFLRNYACAHEEPWTRDIFPHHWRPDPVLCREEHRQLVAAETDYLRERYGLIIG
ncbi:MAG: glycosyltransferase, partial [Lentisphaerae bacterium]